MCFSAVLIGACNLKLFVSRFAVRGLRSLKLVYNNVLEHFRCDYSPKVRPRSLSLPSHF